MSDGIYMTLPRRQIRFVYKGRGYDALCQPNIMNTPALLWYTYICPLTKISAILYGIPENYKEMVEKIEKEELTK